jgi:predicted metal-dependent hydrolase
LEHKELCLDGGRRLSLTLRHHPRARRVKLSLDHRSRSARVTLPAGLPLEMGLRFAEEHKGWLAARLDDLEQQPAIQPGASIPFGGGSLELLHEPHSRRVWLEEGSLHVGGEPEFFARRVMDFFCDWTRKDLSPRVLAKAERLGKRVKRISIRDQKTRWGSCSARGSLSFSWRIGLAPEPVRDYLAAHEVAHLAEMNHGPRFWATCDGLCPGGRKQRDAAEAWLKGPGRAVMALALD